MGKKFFLKRKFLDYLEIEHIFKSVLKTGCVGAVSLLRSIKATVIQHSWKKYRDVKFLNKYFQNMRNTGTNSAAFFVKELGERDYA